MRRFLLLAFLIPTFPFAQEFNSFINKNALEIEDTKNLEDTVYSRLENKQLIMVGEYHGTNEPAELAAGLVKLILNKEGKVSLGLEIPKAEMLDFIENPSLETLASSKFFTKENVYGVNGQAWYDLIASCVVDSNVQFFFMDNFRELNLSGSERDSALYLAVANQRSTFPNMKIVTITGKVHNSFSPYGDQLTMGYYCMNDSLFSKEKTCAITHHYSGGTLMNNTGGGLELRTLEFTESDFSKSASYHNYLLFMNEVNSTNHNCIWYTREVHHSGAVKQ